MKVVDGTSFWIPQVTVRFVTEQCDLEQFMTATLYALFPVDCPVVFGSAATDAAKPKPVRDPSPGEDTQTVVWPLPLSQNGEAMKHTIICDAKFRHSPSKPAAVPEWLPPSFPKEVSLQQLHCIVEELKELKQTVWYKPRNTGASGFNIVGLTFVADTLQITLLDMKDEQNNNGAEVAEKLQSALCTHLWREFRENNADIKLSIELVIAGRCDDKITFCDCPGMVFGATPK